MALRRREIKEESLENERDAQKKGDRPEPVERSPFSQLPRLCYIPSRASWLGSTAPITFTPAPRAASMAAITS